MHVLIPFASGHSEVSSHVLRDLALPSLERLLRRLQAGQRWPGDETTLSAPHERALAAAWGWPQLDGVLPLAAMAAAADGVDVGVQAWGLLTPAHWNAGRDHVAMTDPAALELDASESRALFDVVRELFDSEGFTPVWGAPLRWYLAHPSLAGLACASLDRVIGRDVNPWLAKTPPQRMLRRLQSEVQLLLYTHPLNQAREDRGALPVNSFWLSGCGVHLPQAGPRIEVLDALRAPLLANDWAAWAQAWQALDAEPIAALERRCAAGEGITLTLCGERHAQSFESQTQTVWQRLKNRWQGAAASTVLEAL
jgi:hypothetical protein